MLLVSELCNLLAIPFSRRQIPLLLHFRCSKAKDCSYFAGQTKTPLARGQFPQPSGHPVQGSLPSADSYGISAASVTLSRLQTDTQAHPGGSASEQTPHRPEACRSRLLSPVFSTFPRDLRTEVLGAPCTERHLRNLRKSLAPGPSGNADGSSAHGPSSSKALIRVWSVEHWDVSAASASCLPYASPDGTARTFPVAPVASPSSADSWILRTRGDSDTSGPCCCPPVPCRSLSRPTDAH